MALQVTSSANTFQHINIWLLIYAAKNSAFLSNFWHLALTLTKDKPSPHSIVFRLNMFLIILTPKRCKYSAGYIRGLAHVAFECRLFPVSFINRPNQMLFNCSLVIWKGNGSIWSRTTLRWENVSFQSNSSNMNGIGFREEPRCCRIVWYVIRQMEAPPCWLFHCRD